MKIEDFLVIFNGMEEGQTILLPLQVHEGLRKIIDAFGSVQKAKEFFINVKDASPAKYAPSGIGETKNV